MTDSLKHTSSPGRGALVAVLLVACAAACEQQTGLVIRVTTGELAAEPDSLQFFVGVDAGELELTIPNCGTVARFVDESDQAREVVDVAGRDLATDPYRLLLRPDAALLADQDVMVVVAALKGAEVLGMGSLQAPVRFVPDKVLEWPVKVTALAQSSGVLGSGCACAQLEGGGAVAVTPTEDRDCDGDVGSNDCNDHDPVIGKSKSEVCFNNIDDDCDATVDETEDADGDGFNNCKDCDDRNGAVNEGADEICDGFDNNCIAGDEYPDHVSCYAQVSGECYVGKRVCNDFDPLGGGWQTECLPLSLDPEYMAPREFCNSFDECTGTFDYKGCFDQVSNGAFATAQCTLFYTSNADGTGPVPCAGEWLAPGPTDGVCTWTLLGGSNQGPYVAELQSEATGEVGAVVNACQPTLHIREFSEAPYPATIRLWLASDQVLSNAVELEIRPESAAENICPVNGGLVCTEPTLPPTP